MPTKKLTTQEIEEIIASTSQDGKEINNWKFGIELEYGGYNNKLDYDPAQEDEIIETIKTDGSVAGDGTEYNLKPLSFETLKSSKKLIKALESFCYRAANKRCTISNTAGMHIHFSWDKEFDTPMGAKLGRILFASSDEIFTTTFNQFLKESRGYPSLLLNNPVESFDWKEPNETYKKWFIEKAKLLYEAFQFIYSVSNRDGTEHYGLGTGYTRGYSHHKTLELRCWRTSYDFREIVARVFIARFFLQYILRLGLYTENELYDEIENMETIWEMINKEENAKLKSMYEYLAYNCRNKHKMGLPLHMLMAKLGTMQVSYPAEIKRRSDIYNKALTKNTSAKKAKETFETIISFNNERNGEEDESRI